MLCGGTIISTTNVLTAAQCLTANDIGDLISATVYAGNIYSDRTSLTQQTSEMVGFL